MGFLEHKKSPGNNFWPNKDINFNCSDVDANNEYLRGINWLTDRQTDNQKVKLTNKQLLCTKSFNNSKHLCMLLFIISEPMNNPRITVVIID